MAKLLELSMKELERVKVLSRVVNGDLTQVLAAKMLAITERQVRNLYWFEGRGPPCVLMVCVDDATSIITNLHFSKTEDLEAY